MIFRFRLSEIYAIFITETTAWKLPLASTLSASETWGYRRLQDMVVDSSHLRRIKQNTQDFDDPDVLFRKIGATTAQTFGDRQSAVSVVSRKRMKVCPSRWRASR